MKLSPIFKKIGRAMERQRLPDNEANADDAEII